MLLSKSEMPILARGNDTKVSQLGGLWGAFSLAFASYTKHLIDTRKVKLYGTQLLPYMSDNLRYLTIFSSFVVGNDGSKQFDFMAHNGLRLTSKIRALRNLILKIYSSKKKKEKYEREKKKKN